MTKQKDINAPVSFGLADALDCAKTACSGIENMPPRLKSAIVNLTKQTAKGADFIKVYTGQGFLGKYCLTTRLSFFSLLSRENERIRR